MNNQNAAQFLPLVQALAEGKIIQFCSDRSVPERWTDMTLYGVSFSHSPENYRIKPEPVIHESWNTLYPMESYGQKIVYIGGAYSSPDEAKQSCTSKCAHILHIKYVDGVPSAEFIPFTK